jgi:phenylalanyl-tRNA synthetase beta chain
MRVVRSWLEELVPVGLSDEELAALMDRLGLVVERLERPGERLDRVVVARVLAVAPIEGADRIRRVTVDAGTPYGVVEVVCGAWNFDVGDAVAYAPPGTTLPSGARIERRRIRGVDSAGMLCSGAELGLDHDATGLLLLGEAGSEPGAPLVEALGLAHDTVLEVSAETNRADALSLAGVARDVAAAMGLPLHLPEPDLPASCVAGAHARELARTEVEAPDLCGRLAAWVISGIAVGDSPPWLARRLRLAGMRPVNNVVDASNYAMLELGQPTHPYDLGRLGGPGLRARAARPGEELVTLDGTRRVLGARRVAPGDDLRDCVIADLEDRAVGIGGVMGGEHSAISPSTTAVLLEAAWFDPGAIARTSKRLGLRTEASIRFERGCDPEGIERTALRVAELVLAHAPDAQIAQGFADARGRLPERVRVRTSAPRVNRILGTDLSAALMRDLLAPLGFFVVVGPDDALDVAVPSFRPDVTAPADLAEEVARLYGYDRLPRRRLRLAPAGGLEPLACLRRRVRTALAALGADEAWTSSFVAARSMPELGLPEPVRIANPVSPDEDALRPSLLPGLLAALATNVGRQEDDVRFFEIGRVFSVPSPERLARALAHPAPPPLDEREHVAVLFGRPGDDAHAAWVAWRGIAALLGVEQVTLVQPALEPALLGGGADVAPRAGRDGLARRSDREDGAQRSPHASFSGDLDLARSLGFEALHPGRRGLLVAPAPAARGSDAASTTEPATTASLVGVVGELRPEVAQSGHVELPRRVGWLAFDLGALLAAIEPPSAVAMPSRYPASDIDLAFEVAEDVPTEAVRRALVGAAGDLVERVALFDVYRGPALRQGTRSLAFRIRLRAPDRTLSDRELAALRERMIAAAADACGARLRA